MVKYLYFSILVIIGVILVMINQVNALTVSPPRIEIFANAGETFKGEFLLFNEQLETKTFYSSSENFEASGDEGAPSFVSGNEGLASWIETEPEMILEPGEQIMVPYTINIPENTPDGGYFAAIFWSTAAPQALEGGQVSVGAKIGILVLLRVGENIEEGGGLLDFSTANDKRLFNSLPITFIYHFQNNGGDRIKPTGELKIKNIIGLTKTTLSANPSDGNILPGSTRKFTINWETKYNKDEEQSNQADPEKQGYFYTVKKQWKDKAIGFYKAKLSLKYGRQDIETVENSYFIFVFPWQLLSFLTIIILLVYFIFKKGIKKYNQWIIKKAQSLKT